MGAGRLLRANPPPPKLPPWAGGGLGDSHVQREARRSLEGHPSARDVESLVNEGRCLRLLHRLSVLWPSGSAGSR